ncbi:MAG: 5-formyltetrahydrofolate cyclo-ligase [bacterium]
MDREKEIIRKRLLAQRNKIPPSEREEKSQLIMGQLIQTPDFSRALSIMIYVSFTSEVMTREMIIYSLKVNKKVIVPVVDVGHHRLILSEIESFDELVPSTYGIMEPQHLRPVQAEQVDLFILPGVAFDDRGVRLGYGGGYFDRLFGSVEQHQKLIGLAFELQMQKELPCAPHDILMNMVITEEKVRFFGSL